MSTQTMSSALGRNVIGLDSAESVGEVKSFVLNAEASQIERVQVAGRGRHPVFAEWSDLESFGSDAVIVKHAADPAESDDQRDVDAAKGKVDILGSKILDTAGVERGTVSDVEFDNHTGAIVAVTSSDEFTIRSTDIKSLGTYALVVNS